MRLETGPVDGRSDPALVSNNKKGSMFTSKRNIIVFIALLATAYYFTTHIPASWSSTAYQASPPCADDAPRATINNGKLCGIHSDTYNQDYFLGVAYSKPPLDSLRFRRAQPVNTSWSGIRPATQYPRHCVGYGPDQDSYPFSEDCLYLNIVRPRKPQDQNAGSWDKLPVAVWIHGGALIMGGTADRRYNLSFIVQEGVDIKKPFIGVSINYRLAAWGFLAGKEILDKGDTNNGYMDQRLALHWIQENIAAFGGDPRKVTIWGQSAGGTSIGHHLTAYGGRDDGLFRAAVLESAGGFMNKHFRPIDAYEAQYQDLLEQTSCQSKTNSLTCLQKVPFEKLHDIFKAKPHAWKPIVDGGFIKSYTTNQADANEFVKVPIISGTNTDESTIFAEKGINSPDRFKTMIENRFTGDVADKVLNAYPDDPCFGLPDLGCKTLGSPYGAQFRRLAAFDGDAMFVAPRRLMCETWAEAGLPAYCYRFNARAAGVPEEIGVPHITEVAFVFSNTRGLGFDPPRTPPFQGKGPEYAELAQFMSRLWASFFSDMDPNSFRSAVQRASTDTPDWPEYKDSKKLFLLEPASPFCCSVEDDSFRGEGIALINQASAEHRI